MKITSVGAAVARCGRTAGPPELPGPSCFHGSEERNERRAFEPPGTRGHESQKLRGKGTV